MRGRVIIYVHKTMKCQQVASVNSTSPDIPYMALNLATWSVIAIYNEFTSGTNARTSMRMENHSCFKDSKILSETF